MEQKHSAENLECQRGVESELLRGRGGDAGAAVAAETVEVVRRHRSRVRQRDAASYGSLSVEDDEVSLTLSKDAIKSHELQPEMMKILYLHSTPTVHSIPCLNVFFFQMNTLK